MQKKILSNLLVVSICGIVLSAVVFFAIQTVIARKAADEISVLRLNDVEKRILSNDKQLEELIEIVREDNLARARALAILIDVEPEIIKDNAKLNEVAAALDVDEIHIIDENGILQWGTQPFKYGMNFADKDQTRPFLAILEDPSIEISQVPMPNASLGVVRQYAGVSLLNAKGIAEVGVAPKRMTEALENNKIGNVLHDVVIGGTGYMFSVSAKTGFITSHPDSGMVGVYVPERLNESGFMNIGGQKVWYHTRVVKDEILVTAFPVAEMYRQRTVSTGLFLIFIIILFILFCLIINSHIKKNMITGIRKILSTLDKITNGDLSTTADVRHNEEFNRLSDGINHMLASIKLKIDEVSEAVIAAEEASNAKSSFLANMSHEIRTPMNGVIGFSELALGSNVTLEAKNDYLRKIKTSGEGLLQIINDILDISKIESGKIELECIPFELREVFRVCQTIIMPKALEKGITLYCYAEPSIGKKLLGDPTRLRQVLLNLLSNAVKFTNTGMVKLLSAIEDSSDSTVTIHFEVKDSGIGMSPEQIEKIFRPFTQADSTTTRKFGGTGLGLAITKSTVELMGGELTVESALGIGSKFSFTLTFKTIDTNNTPDDAEIVINELEVPTFKGDVLVCEDNEINQQVISDHLARLGLDIVIAANGQEGVDIARQRMEAGKPFDLILMDIHMPVMDGLQATNTLTEIGSETPVVAMTANVMETDKETYRMNGMRDYLAKPFQTRDLWICLYKYFTPLSLTAVDADEQKNAEAKRRERLLTNFVRDYQNVFQDINVAINNNDIKTAHRMAHTLKGLAGMMGMTELQEAASAVERALAKGESKVTTDQMDALEYELNIVLEELAPLLSKPKQQPSESISLDREKAAEVFAKLEMLLIADSAKSIELTDELRAIPGTDVLIEQLEAYELDLALETLAALRQTLGILRQP